MIYTYKGQTKIKILGKVLESGEKIEIKEGQEGLLNKDFFPANTAKPLKIKKENKGEY